MGFKGKYLFSNKEDTINMKFSDLRYEDKNLVIEKKGKGKFFNDELFFINENKLFILDGTILNNSELISESNEETWEKTYLKLYKEDSQNFLSKLRGNFVGIIYDIKNKKLTLFTDQLKNKNIYYTITDDNFIFSTNPEDIFSLDKSKNKLDVEAAYLLLTFGGTLEKRTLFKNIKKLSYGTLMELDQFKNIKEDKYYRIEIEEDSTINENKAIEKIEELFTQAVQREYKKDSEYGYIHLTELSAGRDSRMNTWFAKKMGYDNIVNITFSQTNELDEKIPKQITSDLKNEWIFKSLDNGIGIFDEKNIEEITKITCGEVHYGTVAHSYNIIKYLNLDVFGLLHSGQLGDVVIGNFGDNTSITSNNLSDINYVYSRKLLKKIEEKGIIQEYYKNEEEFNYVNRGIYVTNGSYLLFPESTVVSPFLDIDFLNFCLKIPYNLRKGKVLYDNWILKKNKEMAKYTHNGRKIGEKEIKILGRTIPLSQIFPKILKKLKILKNEKGMNPFDSWYSENISYRDSLNSYFKNNISRLDQFKELKNDCTILYENGNVREKLQVIGLLATLKLYSTN